MTTALPAARPMMIAHRAANDLERARAAYEAGADLLECDVWLYRGRLELRHTKTVRGMPLLWDRWSLTHSFGPRLTLAAMLDALDPAIGLMLDLKGNDPALPAAVLAALDRRPRRGALAVCSQNWDLLEPFAGDGTARIHSIGKRWRLRAVLAGDAPPLDAISIHERFLTPDVVSALKQIAPIVISWPINDAARMGTLCEQGVDGMITDNLELISATTPGKRPA